MSKCGEVERTPIPTEGHLYRGVSASHPALKYAKQGRAVPAREIGGASAKQHNEGGFSGNSMFTSWTDNLEIARYHATKDGDGGVILSAPFGAPSKTDKWSWEVSDDIWMENERLLKGTREGLGVHDP